jgi:hypothetical protein
MPDTQPETLLIAEDDPLLMPLLKATFRNSGLRVLTAGTGTQATDSCQHWCRHPTNDPAPSVGGRVWVGNLGSLLAIGGLRSGGSVAGSLATGCGLAVGGWDEACVDLGGELVDQLGQLGVGMQFQLARDEVVVGLGLLESGLPVLPDHHKGGQEYRLKRDDEGKGRPGTLLEHEHPYGEERRMQVHEVHRAGEGCDPVRYA